ncbi:MAG: T9SS type A sorting domain-containing protein [Bacteroidetes bacterium]|nr:T9SS type A sorting domain-containing protein [Bacteroidota bacterium]
MNRPFLHKPFVLLALAGSLATAQAANVDITMVPNSNGQLDIKLRPSANFDGLVSSLVFTVRWDAGTEAHLGAIQQADPAITYLPVSRSGGEQDAGGERYQIFVGFGMTPMQWIPTNWVAGQEYTVATIAVTGTAEFSLVNDNWTSLNNADYYLALGGLDETGEIYGGTTTGILAGEAADGGVSVVPNPTDKASVITLELKQAQDLNLELLNAAGQVVWKESKAAAFGTVRIPLDLSTLDKGVYLLRIHRKGDTITQRVVKR